MYNGIGLKTVRGTSTSGYVQRNKSHVNPSWIRKRVLKQTPADVLRKQRKLDPELIIHRRKRQVEVKLCEERIKMEDAGILTKESIDIKINKLRKELLEKLEQEDEIEEGEIVDDDNNINSDNNNNNVTTTTTTTTTTTIPTDEKN